MLLYPSHLESDGSGSDGWHLNAKDETEVNKLFGSTFAAVFTSINMLFFGVSVLRRSAEVPSICLRQPVPAMLIDGDFALSVGHRPAGQGAVATAGDLALYLLCVDGSSDNDESTHRSGK